MLFKPNTPGLFFCFITISLFACHQNASTQQAGSDSSDAVAAYGGTTDSTPVGKTKPDPNAKEGLNLIKYKDGVIKAKGYYKNGYRDGEWQSFYESGKLWSDEYFTNGLADGKISVYYESGQMMYQGQNKAGKPNGTWTYWNEKGQVVRKANYDNKAANTAL